MNNVKTVLLLGLLSGLLLLAGEALGGRDGLWMGLMLAILMNFVSYFFSDRIALAMYSAQPVSETENPSIYRRLAPLVRGLCQRMGLPMPKLYLIPEASPNAFATGRNPKHASVAVTAGLLELMDDRELEGVLGHELGHVRNRDILISTIAATLAAAITFVARMAFWFGGRRDSEEDSGSALGGLLMLIVAPIAALLIQMAISRTREYAADATGAQAAGQPFGLISALKKLDAYARRIPMDASPATAHMFIVMPLGGGGALLRLFSTHPPIEERVRRLQAVLAPRSL